MHSLNRARYLLTSDFGRRNGWVVELDGSPVGVLEAVRSEEMFWDSYAVVPTSAGPTSPVFDDALWNDGRFTFRSRGSGDSVTKAFCGGSPPFVREGRVLIRGLYLSANGLTERLLLRGLGLLWRRKG